MADAEKSADPADREFEVGASVVIREDFHSKYFQGMEATIAGPARKGGTPQPLWPLEIPERPHKMLLPGKYLRLPSEPPAETESAPVPAETVEEANADRPAKKSLLTRIIPWGRK